VTETTLLPRPITVVGISGSPTNPSRTTALVSYVADAVAEGIGGTATTISLAPLLGELSQGPYRSDLGPAARDALDLAEQADILVVGSPAYRATYTGLFKLFFDQVGQYSLADKPIVLTATGGSDRHALLVEHQMRPLFGFFQSLTLPLGIYGSEADFTDYQVTSIDLKERVQTAVRRTVPVLTSRLRPLETAGAQFSRSDYA